MKILTSPTELQTELKKLKMSQPSLKIGFVPTMGALHAGHESLLSKSRQENDISVLSIFVNPTQFNDPTDFSKYPKTLEADQEIAKRQNVDLIFLPSEKSIYPDDYQFKVQENQFSKILCGAHRPGHFDGVLTVVLKLLQIVKPSSAYFGEKDYQQLLLIQQMVAAFFLDIQIVPVETKREIDGLAMSSRNTRLSAEQRKLAPLIYEVLKSSKTTEEAKQKLSQNGFKVDYVEDHFGRRFIAAFLGEVRLIDNAKI